MIGSAAFLFPDGRIVPLSTCPPWTTNCKAFMVDRVGVEGALWRVAGSVEGRGVRRMSGTASERQAAPCYPLMQNRFRRGLVDVCRRGLIRWFGWQADC